MSKNKYFILAILSILFIAVRLLILYSCTTEIFSFDELYIGTTAKEIIDGPVLPVSDYMPDSIHRVGRLVAAILTVPFFALFGPSYFVLKLVTIFFSLVNLILIYLFLWKFFRRSVAVIAGLLIIFSPALYTKFSLMMLRAHSELIFFSMAAVFIFYQIFFREKPSPPKPRAQFDIYADKNIYFAILGIVSGLGVYFRPIFIVTVIACFLFWFIFDKLFFVRRSFFIFLVFFVIGISPLIHHYLIHQFTDRLGICSDHFLASPRTRTLCNPKNLLIYDLPNAFSSGSSVGNVVAYIYYIVFIISYCVLFWMNRAIIARLALGIIPSKKLHIMPSHIQREAFLLVYPLVFIVLYPFLGYAIQDRPVDYRVYMRLILLYPFIFIIISLFLQKLWGFSRGRSRVGVVVFFITTLFLIATGIAGNYNIAGGASSYRNYLRQREGYAYELVGFSISDIYGDNIQDVSKLAYQYARPYRPFIFTGIGHGIAWRFFQHEEYRDINECSEIIDAFDESYRPYVLVGFGMGTIRCNPDIVHTIALLDQMHEKYRPQLYRGVGWFIGLEFIEFKKNMNKSIAMINNVSERYRLDCYRGLGECFGRIFGGVSCSVTLLSTIPAEYQCAAFEGLAKHLGWRYQYYLKKDSLGLVKNIPKGHQTCFMKGLRDFEYQGFLNSGD